MKTKYAIGSNARTPPSLRASRPFSHQLSGVPATPELGLDGSRDIGARVSPEVTFGPIVSVLAVQLGASMLGATEGLDRVTPTGSAGPLCSAAATSSCWCIEMAAFSPSGVSFR